MMRLDSGPIPRIASLELLVAILAAELCARDPDPAAALGRIVAISTGAADYVARLTEDRGEADRATSAAATSAIGEWAEMAENMLEAVLRARA